jgi:hypothetical protein
MKTLAKTEKIIKIINYTDRLLNLKKQLDTLLDIKKVSQGTNENIDPTIRLINHYKLELIKLISNL